MLFNNLDKEAKMEILQENLVLREKDVYLWMIRSGLNPSEFDETTFEVEEAGVTDPGLLQKRQQLKDAITILNVIINEINLLEQ
jgi:hypothetical protein